MGKVTTFHCPRNGFGNNSENGKFYFCRIVSKPISWAMKRCDFSHSVFQGEIKQNRKHQKEVHEIKTNFSNTNKHKNKQ